jgi:hypothetical protein
MPGFGLKGDMDAGRPQQAVKNGLKPSRPQNHFNYVTAPIRVARAKSSPIKTARAV